MIFQPTYFSPISQYQQIVKADKVVFEVFDNYQKQTYRSRFKIFSANGLLNLSIPVKYSNHPRSKTRDVLIDSSFKWQLNHWRSLKNAYQSSPYFEFYEDDLAPFYEKEQKFLLDFLLKTQELVFDMLQLDIKPEFTETYVVDYQEYTDFRALANAKNPHESYNRKEYKQVFDNKYGFLPNLSILDLIFNEGPNALLFL